VVQQIRVQELAARMKQGEPIFLLDVRQPWEHDLAALPGSTLIPLSELPGRAEEVQPAEGALVVVYCHHGIRSLSGAAILGRLGFPRVASLAGGIDAWSLLVDPAVARY
jgi:adenylyltransferase/sulfurtransferase